MVSRLMALGIGLIVGGVLFRQMETDPDLARERREILEAANQSTWGLSTTLLAIGAAILVLSFAYGMRLLAATRREKPF